MKRLSTVLGFGACLLAAAGCQVIPPPSSDTTRTYVLSGSALPPAGAAMGTLRLGLKSVTLPAYLKRQSMVVRTGANEIGVEDFQRWGEPLDDGIARLLRTRLMADPAVSTVTMQPFAFDIARDYDIEVDVIRCEGAASAGGRGEARFSAMIEITTAGPNPRVVARKTFTAPDAAWDGHDFGRLASLLSADIEALGQEIAAALPAAPDTK